MKPLNIPLPWPSTIREALEANDRALNDASRHDGSMSSWVIKNDSIRKQLNAHLEQSIADHGVLR